MGLAGGSAEVRASAEASVARIAASVAAAHAHKFNILFSTKGPSQLRAPI